MTALEVISSALRIIHSYAPGEIVDTADANDGLMSMNQMIDGWNADRLAIFTTRSDDFPFVIGQQAYTLGTGGNFNIARPARIDAMSSILLQAPANPIEVPIQMYSVDQWQTELPVKTVNSSWPQVCYDDGGFPLRTLNFWPIPSQNLNSVRIYSWQALGQAADLTTDIAFPPGYAETFRYNLALRMNGEWGGTMSEVDMRIAIESLARIKTMNAPDLFLTSDLTASEGGYNYRSDLFNLGF